MTSLQELQLLSLVQNDHPTRKIEIGETNHNVNMEPISTILIMNKTQNNNSNKHFAIPFKIGKISAKNTRGNNTRVLNGNGK